MEASAIKQEDAGEHKSSVATWSNFPAGLRVLVVDDDPLCLKIIAQMLKRCDYEGEYWLVGESAAGQTMHTLLLILPRQPPAFVVQSVHVSTRLQRWNNCATRPTIMTWCCLMCICQVGILWWEAAHHVRALPGLQPLLLTFLQLIGPKLSNLFAGCFSRIGL